MLSLIGFPSTAGFIGKFFVFASAVYEQYMWLALIGVINSVISVYYYFNIVRLMFFTPGGDATKVVVETSALRFVWVISAVMVFVIGIFPQQFIELVRTSSKFIAGA